MTTLRTQPPAWFFVVFPATAMLLGWGLRGYIGGGTYGAMIPGVFVALSICALLGYRMETAALAAVFGAMGVGQGGTETYGQTLGFVRESSTLAWGVLGCTIKGAVWGLLGGAVLGLGLDRTRYDRRTTILALLITIPAFIIGVQLINAPKYPSLYFSNLLDRPRGESWAGLLLAAIALLGYLRARGSRKDLSVPLQFSLWGGAGGAIGFGGGCLWLFIGPESWRWVGWWKLMEFSFGFVFGAALGWCAWLNRERLAAAGQQGAAPEARWGPFLGYLALVLFMMNGRGLVSNVLPAGFRQDPSFMAELIRFGLMAAFSFMTFGALTITGALSSLHTAWQAAITLTVYHTVLDYTRDLGDVKPFGYTLATHWQQMIPVMCAAIVGVLVYRLMQGPRPVQRLLLLVVWACYLSGCARSFFHHHLLFPPTGVSRLDALLDRHPSVILTHGIFTLSAVLTTWFVLNCPPASPEREALKPGAMQSSNLEARRP